MTTIGDVPLPLRTRLVHLAIHEVRENRWTPDRAARELRWIGLNASGPRVASAAKLSGRAFRWQVSRLVLPLEVDCPTHRRRAV